MENEELFSWRKELENINDEKENEISALIIRQYYNLTQDTGVIFTGSGVLDVFYNYFRVKGTNNEKVLLDLLYKFDFDFSMSIHNSIYYLLGKKEELKEGCVSPLGWPGVNSYTRNGSDFVVNTNLGKIKVRRASDIIESEVFKKHLMNQCYERTYDFLKENRDYRAVLSLMPSFLSGDHYHAYLEKDGNILDIAANAYYEDKKSIDTIFCGEEIVSLTYDEVEEEHMTLKRIYPNLRNNYKLHSIAVYHDKVRNKK